ncbi:tether containing UBX domain for GLUT4 isoform X2 [Trichoplusia ni]|nr:tether containing UBX domain for GLUT4 isoform X2 [Trichoplusia ni]XP_026730519.1 tether containing UBX domain for GLUT4 isoform X2 [Trichoplusia ni]
MVEAEKKRQETIVTIGLQLEDGERRTADFPPNTSLYDLIVSLAPGEFNSLQQPTISYMRQEVVGQSALQGKTLRQLGLIKGRAILRLLNKQEESRQANVSAVYRRPVTDVKVEDKKKVMKEPEQKFEDHPGPSEFNTQNQFKHQDPISKFKETTLQQKQIEQRKLNEIDESSTEKMETQQGPVNQDEPMDTDTDKSQQSFTSQVRQNLERRLKIEEEVTFLGTHKAVAYMQPDSMDDEIDDLPDDFYELSIEEVRRLYHDLQQHRIELESTPLLSSSKREEIEKQASKEKLNTYKNVVVRIQFPDNMILQGIFTPLNTIADVNNFIKEHLKNSHKNFHIFTTPLKETLEPKMTLLDAKFVPCVHLHFKWTEEDPKKEPYLKDDVYSKITASDAACILASKYRAPTRRKPEESAQDSLKSRAPTASTSKSSKQPKWFKN